jgi:hypothetical protein
MATMLAAAGRLATGGSGIAAAAATAAQQGRARTAGEREQTGHKGGSHEETIFHGRFH